MIIRSELVTRGAKLLEGWEQATEFTKMYLVMEWSTDVGGLTIYEMAVILFPELTSRTGAPTDIAVAKTKSLRQRVRHSDLNNTLVPFALIKRIAGPNRKTTAQWVNLNIKDEDDWTKVVLRMTKVMEGYQGTIEKFGKRLELGLVERNARIRKFLEEKKRELQEKLEEQERGLIKTSTLSSAKKRKNKK
jgi:hypothetical protein